MLYLYTQPFTADYQTPFWQTVASTRQRGAADTLFLTATRGMQRHLKQHMATWTPTEGLLPDVLTFDDLIFDPQDGFAALGFSHVYLLEQLLQRPQYQALCAHHPPYVVAQTLFDTFSELQKHMVFPDQLAQAMRSTTPPAQDALSALFRDFVSAGQDWPFLSRYASYQTTAFKHKKWAGKTVFLLGFWELPPYQRPLLKTLIREASTTAIQLHYSLLSPVYEAAEPFCSWLRATYPDMREIPFHGTPIRPKIEVFACDTVTEEVQFACALAAKNPSVGLLIPEADPYHTLLRQYGSYQGDSLPPTAPCEMPLFSFLMALLDQELPGPAAMSRLLSHIMVAGAIPEWHWPKIATQSMDRMAHWQWGEWERVLGKWGDNTPIKLLQLARQIQTSTHVPQIFTACVSATACLGQPLTQWPAILLTGVTQACSILARIGGGASRLRSILKNTFGSPQALPHTWPCYGKFESHLVHKDHWILLGCRDGVWPKVMRKSYALPVTVIRQLGLPTPAHYVRADSYLFHAVLHQATGRVSALYPRMHEDVPQTLTLFLSGFEVRPAPTMRKEQTHGLALTPNNPVKLHPDALAQLDLYRFSPTRLEQYQGCPYQYYLKHILELPETRPPLEVGPGVMGELIHDALQALTAMYRGEGQQDGPEQQQRAVRIAITKQQARYGSASINSWLLAAKASLLLGTDKMPGILPETLQALSDANMPLHAIAEEVSLGKEPPLVFSVFDTCFALTGRIDALYALHGTDMVMIVDYKTGSKAYAKKDLETYRNLQLPLYVLMAQREYPDKDIIGAAIVYARHREPGIDIMTVTPEGKIALDLKRKRPVTLDEVYRHDTLFHTEQVVRSIREGRFGLDNVPVAAPFIAKRKELCAYCNYRWCCDFPERWG